MFTDTHCHVLSDKYYNPLDIILNLEKDNIKRIIINGFDLKSNKEVINLVNYDRVYGALGIHPDNILAFNNDNVKFIESNLGNKKIIAIGEIGLDYYHNKDNKEEQIKMFEYFLNLAEKVSLPVIIHSRDATDDLLRVLKRHKCKGIIHCFSGSLETAKEYIKLGYKLGIGGVVTFKNCNLKDVLVNIDINNILLETDSPYLAPVPLRGTFNEPVNVNIIADYLCSLYNISLEELANKLEDNFNDLFNI